MRGSIIRNERIIRTCNRQPRKDHNLIYFQQDVRNIKKDICTEICILYSSFKRGPIFISQCQSWASYVTMKIKIYSQSVLSKLVDPPLGVVSDKAFY